MACPGLSWQITRIGTPCAYLFIWINWAGAGAGAMAELGNINLVNSKRIIYVFLLSAIGLSQKVPPSSGPSPCNNKISFVLKLIKQAWAWSHDRDLVFFVFTDQVLSLRLEVLNFGEDLQEWLKDKGKCLNLKTETETEIILGCNIQKIVKNENWQEPMLGCGVLGHKTNI